MGHLNIFIITGYLRRIVPGAKLNLWLNLSLNLSFLQTVMESLFSEAVKKMVKAFENRANYLYNTTKCNHL